VIESKRIAKLQEHASKIFCCIRTRGSVVQMYFNLSPTCMAMFGETIKMSLIVLLGRVEICVDEGTTFGIAPSGDKLRILAAPAL
jgi:hypothetical protein